MVTLIEWVIAIAALILAGIVWDGIGMSMNPKKAGWYYWAVSATYPEWLAAAKNAYRRQDRDKLRMMLCYTINAFRLTPDQVVLVKKDILKYIDDLDKDVREEF